MARSAEVVGEFTLHLQCPVVAPAVGDLIGVKIFGRRVCFEVVRVAEYRRAHEVDAGAWATHFVRLRPRVSYLEE